MLAVGNVVHSCIAVDVRQCKHALSVLDNQCSCSKSATATYTKLDLFVVVRDKCYLHTSVSISSLEDSGEIRDSIAQVLK